MRYVLRNPVRAGLVEQAWEYQWSSARYLVDSVASDPLVSKLGPLVKIEDWRTTLAIEDDDQSLIRQHTRTGRPLGDESFISYVEHLLGRRLKKHKPGPPRRS
jgi:putative transposase